MIKTILLYALLLFSIFFIGFQLHNFFIQSKGVELPFSLNKVYLFHFGFTLLIYVNFKLLSAVDKIFEQLGFIYLGTLFFKIILFCIVFYKPLFIEENLNNLAKTALLIPMLIFLLTEAILVSKLLKKK